MGVACVLSLWEGGEALRVAPPLITKPDPPCDCHGIKVHCVALRLGFPVSVLP